MKKDKQDKNRRLTLSRETIQILDDPRLLGLVIGGTSQLGGGCTTRTITFNDNEVISDSNGC
jgi:hypothetical protein